MRRFVDLGSFRSGLATRQIDSGVKPDGLATPNAQNAFRILRRGPFAQSAEPRAPRRAPRSSDASFARTVTVRPAVFYRKVIETCSNLDEQTQATNNGTIKERKKP